MVSAITIVVKAETVEVTTVCLYHFLIDRLGLFLAPMVFLSTLVFSVAIGATWEAVMGSRPSGKPKRLLADLGDIAVGVALVGTVVGLILTFASFSGGGWPSTARAISTAYFSTGIGLSLWVVANVVVTVWTFLEKSPCDYGSLSRS